ncbi:hypothetical protein SNE40_021921 [Patella caerulea]|uniref:acylglycerol lipase n=2 Tax=Patella caerulea TaxID=87958 RepID=A0AAN8GD11_PATCE
MASRRRKVIDVKKEEAAEQNGLIGNKIKKSKKKVEIKDGGSFIGRCCSKVKYLFLLILVPPFLNYASLQKEMTELQPAGEMYDIGWGQKLFMMCKGEGAPTVVLDAPTGMSSDVWTRIWPDIAKHTKVCIYDRAGVGFSERPSMNASRINETRSGQPFTVERMAADLNRLITSSSQQPRPFILVGAELGATVAQFYTQIFESDVSGLVLINPLSDVLFEQDEGLWAKYWFGQLIPTYQTLQLGAAIGLTRLALIVGVLKHPLSGSQMTQDIEYRQKHLLCHPKHLSSVVDEHHFINETFSQIKTAKLLKTIPSRISISIMTGNYYDEQMPSSLNKAWAKAEQQFISKHFPTAQHLVVNGADHHMLYKQPHSVVEVILKMVRQVKLRNKNTKSS